MYHLLIIAQVLCAVITEINSSARHMDQFIYSHVRPIVYNFVIRQFIPKFQFFWQDGTRNTCTYFQ